MPRRAALGALVAAVHLGLTVALWHLTPRGRTPPSGPRATTTARPLTWLTLQPVIPSSPAGARPARTAEAPLSGRRPDGPDRWPSGRPGPARPIAAAGRSQDIPPGDPAHVPADDIAKTPAPPAVGATADARPASVGPASAAPLDLRLPPGVAARTRHPVEGVAALTQRAGVPLEARLAAALGSGRWTEERVDADTVRLRDGRRCVTLKRPRLSSLDPFSEATRRLPWVSDGVKDCGP